MIRFLRLAPLLFVGLVQPAVAADLPYFAGGDLPALKATGSPDYDPAPSNPWTGLTMGAGVSRRVRFGARAAAAWRLTLLLAIITSSTIAWSSACRAASAICRACINMGRAAIITGWPMSRSAMTWAAHALCEFWRRHGERHQFARPAGWVRFG